jgi:hypothetical protein
LKRNIIFLLVLALLLISAIPVINISFAAGDLKVQMNNSNTAATTNSISPKIKLINQSSAAINLSTVTIRYYYTVDGDKAQSYWCDHAAITSPGYTAITSNVTGKFVKMTTVVTGADYYLEIGFTSAAGSLAAGGIVEIQSRFAKTDWSNYTQTNDYSFNPTATNYADTTKVTAYTSGTLASGTEPDGNTQPTVTPTPTVTTITPTPVRTVTPVKTATPTTAIPTPTPTQVTPPPVTPTPGTIVIPPFSSLPAITKLPDPFKLMDGTHMTQKSQWAQRRAEISALAQAFEYGIIPAKPQTVTGSFSSNALTVTCSQNGKSISFKCSIQYPSTGKAPYPAMIGVGMDTLNTSEILKLGVALITFPCEDVASNATKASGVFYTLYGTNYNAGSFAAWTWGVSRMIDALETTPSANIDTKHLGVTGGSRYGKGAMCVGAFEERIALTVPQEGGVSSSGAFRIADAWNASSSDKVEALPNLAGGTCWMAPTFTQFQNQTNKLPFDTHMIHALCMPRGLLLIENPDYVWLGVPGDYQTAQVSRMIFNAFGMQDRIGFSSVGGHAHCSFPASQQPELTAFIQKFLLGNNSVNTNINRTDKTYTFDQAKWVDWTIPVLQ